jgi:hypothetical protein
MRKIQLFVLVVTIVAVVISAGSKHFDNPNILFILADDVGWRFKNNISKCVYSNSQFSSTVISDTTIQIHPFPLHLSICSL